MGRLRMTTTNSSSASDQPGEITDRDRFSRMISDEIARLRAARSAQGDSVGRRGDQEKRGAAQPTAPIARLPESMPALPQRASYRLRDFLAYHDEDFVRNAYRGLLGREPDIHGLDYLAALREGRLAKVEIVGRIRFSREGRNASVPVRGLAFPLALRTLRRVPVLGRFIGIALYVVRLPDIVHTHERFEAAYFHRDLDMRRCVNGLVADIERAVEQRASRSELDDVRVDRIAAALVDREYHQSVVAIQSEVHRLVAELRQSVGGIQGNLHQVVVEMRQSVDGIRGDVRQVVAEMRQSLDGMSSEIGRLDSEKASQRAVDELGVRVPTLEEDAVRFERALERIDRQLVVQRRELADHGGSVGSPVSMPVSSGLAAASSSNGDADRLAAFYVSFEDRFRGTRDVIRQRMMVYVPLIEKANAGRPERPVLDLGSGRGEWLELLRENGRVARGIDANAVMIQDCRERGLDVVDADVITYLRSLEPGTIGAITGMHIIEHLPFEQVVALVDESLRVLVPGGVVAFETPNPENLIVGACSFYSDPTHRRPLPPEPIRFLLEARGFADVEIMRLHPFPEFEQLSGGTDEWRERLNELLFGPQDYAVTGRKA